MITLIGATGFTGTLIAHELKRIGCSALDHGDFANAGAVSPSMVRPNSIIEATSAAGVSWQAGEIVRRGLE